MIKAVVLCALSPTVRRYQTYSFRHLLVTAQCHTSNIPHDWKDTLTGTLNLGLKHTTVCVHNANTRGHELANFF